MSDRETSDPRRIRVFVETGINGATHNDWYDLPEGWDAMTPEEQEQELDEMATDFRNNHINCGAYVVARDGAKE